MFVSVTSRPDLSECSQDFDPATVDHDYLATLIGQTVVRVINQVRTRQGSVNNVEYVVNLIRKE